MRGLALVWVWVWRVIVRSFVLGNVTLQRIGRVSGSGTGELENSC